MQPLIRFRGVDHFYGDGSLRRQILYDISAEVRVVEIVLLTGPFGSGKKTRLLTLAQQAGGHLVVWRGAVGDADRPSPV
jgi:energy-coupling factor transporter ATP-binding protein EcfA2